MRTTRSMPTLTALALSAGLVLGACGDDEETAGVRPTAANPSTTVVEASPSEDPEYEDEDEDDQSGEPVPAYLDEAETTQYVSMPPDQETPLAEQSLFYQVSYPEGWERFGLADPMCNPCDHTVDGITSSDFHDHVLTRSDRPPRHVFSVEPAYTGDSAVDTRIDEAYAGALPATSAIEVNRLLAATLDDGRPVAKVVDLEFYYLSTVGPLPSS